jgi:hypothetical protein
MGHLCSSEQRVLKLQVDGVAARAAPPIPRHQLKVSAVSLGTNSRLSYNGFSLGLVTGQEK